MPNITKIFGEYFHGTVMEKSEPITALTMNGEFEAIWFTEEEEIAKEFVEYRVGGEEIKEYYKVILSLEVKANKIIHLTYEETKNLNEKLEVDDFRENIPFLKKKKYNGWIIPGSIGYHKYEDMCVFYEKLIQVKGISFFIDDDWTEYFDLQKAQEFMDNITKVDF